MPSTLKGERYKVELWIDENGDVEDQAAAHATLTRPKAGALPAQEVTLPITFVPSIALKALLKAEQRAAVDVQVGR